MPRPKKKAKTKETELLIICKSGWNSIFYRETKLLFLHSTTYYAISYKRDTGSLCSQIYI